jgi:hypothetical protein
VVEVEGVTKESAGEAPAGQKPAGEVLAEQKGEKYMLPALRYSSSPLFNETCIIDVKHDINSSFHSNYNASLQMKRVCLISGLMR